MITFPFFANYKLNMVVENIFKLELFHRTVNINIINTWVWYSLGKGD